MMTAAMTDAMSAALIDRGVAQCSAVIGIGDWDEVGRAFDRELRVMHCLLTTISGAADEVEFYGGDA